MWANGGRAGAEAEEGQVDAMPLEKKTVSGILPPPWKRTL